LLKIPPSGGYFLKRKRSKVPNGTLRRDSNGGVMFWLFLMPKQASRVQRSYERSELEKAGRIPSTTSTKDDKPLKDKPPKAAESLDVSPPFTQGFTLQMMDIFYA